MSDNFSIRIMTRQELDLVIDWAAAEGWNPGLHDAHSFYAVDPKGFYIGLLNNQPVASIAVVKYSREFGFLGLYIVKPECRGRGYGFQTWTAGLAHLSDCVIGLDGVISQQVNYKRSGFTLLYRNIRFQGPGGGNATVDKGIVPLWSIPFNELCEFDRRYFPADRSTFLKNWVNQSHSWALAIRENNALAAYGVMRTCRKGYKIGPLFAQSSEQAERLFNAFKTRVSQNDDLFLDVPEPNQTGLALAEKYQLKKCFETARMYRGTAPALPVSKIFGVTTFELG
ncbi:GNAT family N-acetyltransferase [Oligosphaera ethanolica]|jgi:GNAT superfamily N-acetyltransferase|uniref:GNAT superfamily N-acetyltransferase n=1 Tax=Oligosphaera ethanolica TaxID=760260 RepID=A0AAE3VCF8_9BACT|nr:GNAT family N-acetyltransferase [Oligosphaera ethanolica]MDQ0287939.1 GNAT superfamily N-acetyltransferase [Oligosphaera ethanolica]